MVETDVYKYSLNSDDRKQSLKISLINNSHISLVLTNKDTQKDYRTLLDIMQLKQMSQGFASISIVKEGLLIIKDLIESGRLEITEEQSKTSNMVKYVLTLEIENNPPFDISLLLDENNNSMQVNNNNVNAVPNAQNTQNTQSVTNTIINNENKPPMEIEYIEPILQLHYPDGRTENKPLPPVIKGVGEDNQNISEEHMKLIKEQINRDNSARQSSPVKNANFINSNSEIKEQSNFNRANSNSMNNNNTQVNKLKNLVRPLNQNQNYSENKSNNRANSAFNLNMNSSNNNMNNTLNPFTPAQDMNYGLQAQNPNFNNTYAFHNLKQNHNQMIEKRPRLINQRENTMNPNELSQNLMNKFNQQNEIGHAKTQMVPQSQNFQSAQNQNQQQAPSTQIVPLDPNEEKDENGEINIEALFKTGEGKIIFRNGLLRGIIHKYAEIDDVVSRIQDILLKGVNFHLVYKAFDLDDKAQTFHEKCDDLNMSLTLIETDKDVRFGGFTTKSWKGNSLKRRDNNAFVFSLDNHKIYNIIENQPAIGCYLKYGPIFFGCQIRIFDDFFTKGGSTCHKGLNYNTTIDYELNNGEQFFLVKDIEVYSIETINID